MSASSFAARALICLVMAMAGTAASADEATWTVKKSTGQVWITTPGAQQASLTQETTLRIGDTIRTGPNGRVLLIRGTESMLVSPNSVIGLPAENKDGMSTTVTQQAGTILLDVERQNVKHFEVETPYLAAVVKGTQFQVSVDATGSHVTVLRGQVEVADFKSGQIGQILPGQTAAAFSSGKAGLTFSGSGRFYPIEQGAPRPPSLTRIDVPRAGLSAPRGTANGLQFHPVRPMQQAGWVARVNQAMAASRLASGMNKVAHGGQRLMTAIGDVHLDFGKVTHGMAHGAAPVRARSRTNSSAGTIWGNRPNATANANQAGTSDANSINGNSPIDTSIATAIGSATNTTGNGSAGNPPASSVATGGGNGNGSTGSGSGNTSGSGNANGNGASGGNGNRNGNGDGDGNGNGNSGSASGPGNGHGNAYGWHRKHD